MDICPETVILSTLVSQNFNRYPALFMNGICPSTSGVQNLKLRLYIVPNSSNIASILQFASQNMITLHHIITQLLCLACFAFVTCFKHFHFDSKTRWGVVFKIWKQEHIFILLDYSISFSCAAFVTVVMSSWLIGIHTTFDACAGGQVFWYISRAQTHILIFYIMVSGWVASWCQSESYIMAGIHADKVETLCALRWSASRCAVFTVILISWLGLQDVIMFPLLEDLWRVWELSSRAVEWAVAVSPMRSQGFGEKVRSSNCWKTVVPHDRLS